VPNSLDSDSPGALPRGGVVSYERDTPVGSGLRHNGRNGLCIRCMREQATRHENRYTP
jgi:hypothetical protein